MSLNLGPTQQSIQANSVYNQRSQASSNRDDDTGAWFINLALFAIIPFLFAFYARELYDPAIEWQATLYNVGIFICMIVSYFALPLLRGLLGLCFIFVIGTGVLGLGWELINAFLLN